jgi:hypothetical protein
MSLNKQNYTRPELNNKLYLIQRDKEDLIYIKNKIIVNIYEDDIYDKIIDIFEKINEDYISIYGSEINELIMIYNNIIIDIEFDTVNKDSYLIFIYNKNSVINDDIKLLSNVFKFLL